MATEKLGPDSIDGSVVGDLRVQPTGDGLDDRAAELCDAVLERLRGLPADPPEPQDGRGRPDPEHSPMLPGLEGY